MHRIVIGTIDKDGKWEFDHIATEDDMPCIRVSERDVVQRVAVYEGGPLPERDRIIWMHGDIGMYWEDAEQTFMREMGEHCILINGSAGENITRNYFENDIVKDSDTGNLGVVEMWNGRLHVDWGSDGSIYGLVSEYMPEVKGNIHEHPAYLHKIKGLNVGWYDPETKKLIPGKFSE